MNDNILIKQKETEYKEYINNHKLNVTKAWELMKNNSDCIELFKNSFISVNIDGIFKLIDGVIYFTA